MTTWQCGGCGNPRIDMTEMPPPTNRTACSDCGSTSLKFSVTVHEHVGAAVDSVSYDMIPGVQPVGWRQRWQQLQRDVDAVCGPQSTPMCREAILDVTSRLYDLFVRAYHFREYLIDEAGVAMPRADVVAAQDIALCADLCNTEKHAVLANDVKSDARPRFVECRGAANDSEDGWRLEVTIDHGGTMKDGVTALRAAITGWTQLLKGWGLI